MVKNFYKVLIVLFVCYHSFSAPNRYVKFHCLSLVTPTQVKSVSYANQRTVVQWRFKHQQLNYRQELGTYEVFGGLSRLLPRRLARLLKDNAGKSLYENLEMIYERKKYAIDVLSTYVKSPIITSYEEIMIWDIIKQLKRSLKRFEQESAMITKSIDKSIMKVARQSPGYKYQFKRLKKEERAVFTRIYSVLTHYHGLLGELRVAFLVQGMTNQGVRVKSLLANPPQEGFSQIEWAMIADKYLGSGMAILEKEIDVVFHQGLAWAEVKNYQQTLDIKELGRLKALDRIDTILDFFAEVKAMTGKEMKLHYFFLRGGVTREVKDLLIAKGVVVHNAPDIPFALRPN